MNDGSQNPCPNCGAALAGTVPIPRFEVTVALVAAVAAIVYFHAALRRVYPMRRFGAGSLVLAAYAITVLIVTSTIAISVAIA
jgi:hypothetical protein